MRYYERDDHPCDYGHDFAAVWELGVISHYRCRVCGADISDEDYEMEEEEEEDVDVVDDDDMR